MMASIFLFLAVCCILLTVLRQYSSAFAILLSILAAAIALLILLPQAMQLTSVFRTAMEQMQEESAYAVILKIVFIAFISQYVQALCKDAGQASLALICEFCGKCMALIAAAPLFSALFSMLYGVFL